MSASLFARANDKQASGILTCEKVCRQGARRGSSNTGECCTFHQRHREPKLGIKQKHHALMGSVGTVVFPRVFGNQLDPEAPGIPQSSGHDGHFALATPDRHEGADGQLCIIAGYRHHGGT